MTGPPIELPVCLRDYFAGQALAGLLSCPLSSEKLEEKRAEEIKPLYAQVCYQFADAMLAERNKILQGGVPR